MLPVSRQRQRHSRLVAFDELVDISTLRTCWYIPATAVDSPYEYNTCQREVWPQRKTGLKNLSAYCKVSCLTQQNKHSYLPNCCTALEKSPLFFLTIHKNTKNWKPPKSNVIIVKIMSYKLFIAKWMYSRGTDGKNNGRCNVKRWFVSECSWERRVAWTNKRYLRSLRETLLAWVEWSENENPRKFARTVYIT